MNNLDYAAIRKRALRLHELFSQGRIPTLATHEVHPDLPKSSRLRYLYFTLPVSINFQRSSPAMWQSALATYNDPETQYLFQPELVVKIPFLKLQSDLIRHKLGLQRNKHTQIWQAISQTLFQEFDSDPRNVFLKAQNRVSKIKDLLQVGMKKQFPYLSGTKMANYWLYILVKYTDLKLEEMDKISIIPDTHVMQSSVVLGIIENVKASRELVEQLWFEIMQGSGVTPVEMHPVLWNWSRADFKPEV